MTARVDLAVAIPQTFLDDRVDLARIRIFLARAEALGFHSAWVVEQILGCLASLEPKPVQQPHPPLWFGAHHPDALRRAVELGDGFIGAGSISSAAFVEEVKILRGLLAEAGRDPAAFPVGKRVYIAVDRDRARAGRRLGEWLGAFYGKPQLAEQVCVWGDTQECLDRLAEIVAGGARLLLLNPVFDELDHLERFASEFSFRF